MPPRILIVKTSSLGDIVQAFDVLKNLHLRFPHVLIDWAVEARFFSIVAAHPLVHRAISLDIRGRKNLWQGTKELRREKYDHIFDLQGNCKSGMITLLARGTCKVGFGLRSVREWPNILATNTRFNVSKKQNIRSFYLELIERYFYTHTSPKMDGIRFHIDPNEKEKIAQILAKISSPFKIMVCPGSKWVNKQLKVETLIAFLKKIELGSDHENSWCFGCVKASGLNDRKLARINAIRANLRSSNRGSFHASPNIMNFRGQTLAAFLLIWGNEAEKAICQEIFNHLSSSLIVDKLPLPTWQNLMSEVDLVITVDSGALHLCGTTSTPSFSIFGPTSPNIFKPLGPKHFAIQGRCPYGWTFDKQCPLLRSCPTGACIKELTAEELFKAFQNQFA